ncbi:MAG: type I methionyl aminopeptidase [Crenarchaeota archaeon]|nr:MAG: type I methionyl aminopeptidase [Thermoproteota archaeon]
MQNIILKTPEQIEGIKKSCKLAAKTLRYLEQFAVPGNSTELINQKADKFIRDHNAIPACLGYKGFPKSICTSINEVICHGIPSENTVLQEGDVLNIDVTTILDGYYGDTCKMYEIGEISNKAKRILRVAQECLDKGIAAVIPGGRIGDIGAAISQHAHSFRCGVVEVFCGHGVGIEFHEPPSINHCGKKGTGSELLPGMVFTIEPMINERTKQVLILEDNWTAVTRDGGLSAQYEHTILVTDSGHEILTI